MLSNQNDNLSNLSIQEQDLQLFLGSIGIKLPPFDPGLPDEFIISRLDPIAASFLEARENKAFFLAYRIQGKAFPIGIVFLKGTHDVQFCHSTLLLDSYSQETWMVPQLNLAVKELFSKGADFLFGILEPSWKNVPLQGQLDCRIYWNAKPEMKVVTGLFLEKLGVVPEIPFFPSVYFYDNPYEQNLLEAALFDLEGCRDVLSLGTGAGLEAVCVALKYGIHVDATDINPVAIANTLAACRRTGTDQLVNAWVSDGFKQVKKKYDAILFEAPLATDDTNFIDLNRHDSGGKLLKDVLCALPSHLKAGGSMYLMSLPDISPYCPANGLQWKTLRNFEAKRSQAIHKVWCI